MIAFKNSNLTLEILDGKSIMIQRWDGFASSAIFREGIDKSVEMVQQKKISGIISDTRTQAVVKPEDTDYAAAAMPQLMQGGLKAFAFVVPQSIFTQISLDKFKNKTEQNKFVEYFEDLESALKWMETKVR